ncbi:hypothetical protein SprV_0602221400 [Sparganum proliferum]
MVVVSEGTQQICKGDNEDCTTLRYTTGDTNMDAHCRNICAHQRDGLTGKTTAYYCEGSGASCEPYEVYGREGHSTMFERHVMCVLTCQLVGQVESSAATFFKVCDDKKDICLKIERKDFNAYTQCVPKCTGWTDLKKKEEHTAYTCTEGGDCQEGTYFTKPKETPFKSVKKCLKTCLKK